MCRCGVHSFVGVVSVSRSHSFVGVAVRTPLWVLFLSAVRTPLWVLEHSGGYKVCYRSDTGRVVKQVRNHFLPLSSFWCLFRRRALRMFLSCDLWGKVNTLANFWQKPKKKSSGTVKGVTGPLHTTWCDQLIGRPHRLSRIVFKKRLLENRASFRRGVG